MGHLWPPTSWLPGTSAPSFLIALDLRLVQATESRFTPLHQEYAPTTHAPHNYILTRSRTQTPCTQSHTSRTHTLTHSWGVNSYFLVRFILRCHLLQEAFPDSTLRPPLERQVRAFLEVPWFPVPLLAEHCGPLLSWNPLTSSPLLPRPSASLSQALLGLGDTKPTARSSVTHFAPSSPCPCICLVLLADGLDGAGTRAPQ